MRERSRKRPTDVNQLAKQLTDEATSDARTPDPEPEKDPNAVALGRKGGLKGGPARAKKLSAKKRSEIAKRAAQGRWGRKRKG